MSDAKTAEPISIWSPVAGDDGDTVWRRPRPTGLGDHYARRREIRRRPGPGVRRVCFFGESAAAGYLYAPHLTPAQVLEAKLLEGELGRRTPAGKPAGTVDTWEVIDLARTNERSASLAETVEAAAQLAPDHLVIFTGNNPKLLDTPELSPYAPSTAGRRELAAALAEGGAEGMARLARRRWAGELAGALERVAAVAGDLGAGVTLVLPEVNLADWQTAEPPLRLAGDGVARWFALLERARRALAEAGSRQAGDAAARQRSLEAAEAAAWEMVGLDGGLCPTPFRLLAEARTLVGETAAESARDAALSELEATHYPLLACLAAPRADEVARRVLAAACRRHGFAAVDLRPLFAAHTGSPLPGRRLFLDYCHLTSEGIGVAMAAVAEAIAGPGEGVAGAARPPAVSAAAEATACLGAAVHTAHRHLPVTGGDDRLSDEPLSDDLLGDDLPHRDLLTYWCRRALDHDPEGAAAAMLDLASARLAAPPGGPALPALLTAAEERNRARPAPLLLQHGWRWPHVDGDLLRAMHRVLAQRGRREASAMADLVARAGSGAAEALELAHPPRFLATPVARPLPDAMAAEGMPHRAYLRALWPQTSFDVPDPDGAWRRLRVVARRPAAAMGAEEPKDLVAATVTLDGRRVGKLPLTARWQEHTLRLPGIAPRPADQGRDAPALAGLRRLTISWPPPGDAGPEPMAGALHRLRAGLEAELHAIFGELFSVRLLR